MGALLDYDQKAIVRAAIEKLPEQTRSLTCVSNAYRMTYWGANTLFDNDVLEILGLGHFCDSVTFYS